MPGYSNDDIYSFSIAHFPSGMCTVIVRSCRMELGEGGLLSNCLDEGGLMAQQLLVRPSTHSDSHTLRNVPLTQGHDSVCGIAARCRDGGLIIMHHYCGKDENLLVYIKT